MCVPCVLQVSRSFTFKQQCQRSDATLRTFYRNFEDNIIASTNEDLENGSVEVEYQDPNNGEKCLLLVQQFTRMDNQNNQSLTIKDENVLIGSVMSEVDVNSVVENIITAEDVHQHTTEEEMPPHYHDLLGKIEFDIDLFSYFFKCSSGTHVQFFLDPMQPSKVEQHMNLLDQSSLEAVSALPLDDSNIQDHLVTNHIHMHLDQNDLQDHLENNDIPDHLETNNIQDQILSDHFGKKILKSYYLHVF